MMIEIGRDDGGKPLMIEPNLAWSFKDFTNQKNVFVGHGKELGGIVIYKSCFYQEGNPDQDVFPSDVQNLTLAWCNLDNARIPTGVTLISCSTRRIMAHEDGTDWVVDDKNKFVSPLNPVPQIDPTIADVLAIAPDDVIMLKTVLDKYDLSSILRPDMASEITDAIAAQALQAIKDGSK